MTAKELQPLRKHFARHNRRVVGLALATACAALAFWGLIYLVMKWLLLLVLTVANPFAARIPPDFTHVFIASAAVLCALGLFASWLSPDGMSRDKKSAWEIALDFILAVPRMTLAVWGNLRALQFLSRYEMELSRHLLDAIARVEKMPAHQIPLEIPDEKKRLKILFALQITGLIEMRRLNNELTFVLQNENARMLGQPHVRLL